MQKNLNILEEYCKKLKVNKDKTKIVFFRKGGRIPNYTHFYYENIEIEVVNKYCYPGIVFTSGGSLQSACKTLAGQAQKAIF